MIGLPYINHFPGQLLGGRRSTGSSLSDTLGTSSLVEDHSRDQKCMVSLFLFRSNLRDLRDQHVRLIMPLDSVQCVAFPVHSRLVFVF